MRTPPPSGSRTSGASKVFVPLSVWALFALLLHLPWEVAQLPLYRVWQQSSAAPIVFDVLHCTLGDVLIAGTAYAATAAVFRQPLWPLRSPWTGGAMYMLGTVAYAAWSEWRNVYRTGGWAYSAAMPTLAGIGLAPLLQWIVVSLFMLLLFRRTSALAPPQ